MNARRGMTDQIQKTALRCEQVEGPDRDIDLHIMRWVENIGGAAENALHYTSSLDAAMTLLPQKWKHRQTQIMAPCADCRKWHVALHGGAEGEDYFVAFAATPALALCAAALRARLA